MKSHWNHFGHLILSLSLVVSSLTFIPSAIAQTDTSLDQQKADCAKNTAAEWSATTNRCVGKVDDRKTRHDSINCNLIVDPTQKADCFKSIAEQKTGLNSDPGSLNQGSTDKSAVMNGINSAYAILNYLNMFGSKKKETNCMSKKIFGVTALAGTLSDFYLKARAKSKVSELSNKYKLDANSTASAAQIKAFEYLKDEQNTVADIASMEKKRNMLLMIGYGAATAMAIYELTPMGANPDCLKVEKSCKEDKTQASCNQQCSDGTTISIDAKCPEAPIGCGDGQPNAAGTGCEPKPTVAVDCGGGQPNAAGTGCEPKPPTPVGCMPKEPQKVITENADPKPTPVTPAKVEAEKTATIMATTKTVNGKEVAYYNVSDPNDPSKNYYIVDKQVYTKGTNQLAGTLDYKTGNVSIGGSKAFTVGDVQLTSGNSSFVPSGSFAKIHNKVKGG
jgi:hypothetical protein